MKSNQIYVEKCDFETTIYHPEKQFSEIKNSIADAFRGGFYYQESGQPNGILIQLINQRLGIINDSKVYFINLQEREGSYILNFVLIIVNALGNYGGMREGLDYLREDIYTIFKSRLGEEYTINVNYETEEVTEKEIKKESNLFNMDIDKLNRNTKNFVIVGMTICFMLLLFSGLILKSVKDAKSDEQPKVSDKVGTTLTDEKEIERILDKKFDDYVKNRKMDMILERLILQPDTILSKQKK